MRKQIAFHGLLTCVCSLLLLMAGCGAKTSASKSADKQQPADQTVKSDDRTVPASYEKFFPDNVGANKRGMSVGYSSKSGDAKDPFIDLATFFYGEGNPYTLSVFKYSSAAEAQARLDQRVSETVPSDEYLKKIKFPKCFLEGEGDKETAAERAEEEAFNPPEELIKRIPLKSGAAVVIRPPRTWDDDCKSTVNGGTGENVMWADGIYLFELQATPPIGQGGKNIYGEGEAFLKDYLQATGQN